ncbi:hypothetical protein BLA6860_06486 [Burkholderia lata]|nr:hypothetical protein BLA6860_06486 [Burkholderia lata]
MTRRPAIMCAMHFSPLRHTTHRPTGWSTHGITPGQRQHGRVLRLRERRARRARREVREVRHQARAGAPAAEGQHRREEGLLRLGSLQGLQGVDARGQFRADRDSARAPVGQELGRHPARRRRARPLLHEVARRYVRDHQRRLGFFAAGVEAAREREEGDRCRREEIDVGPAGRELRRIHLLRRPGARAAAHARQARTAAARGQRRREAAGRAVVAQARHGRAQGRGDRVGGRDVRRARVGAGRRRQDLGVGAQERDQASQAGFQRVVLRVPRVRQPARRGAGARPARSGTRRQVGRVRVAGTPVGGRGARHGGW